MIRFVEVVNRTSKNPRMERISVPRFELGEVWINKEFVVNIREAVEYTRMLHEGQLPGDLSQEHTFTAVTVNQGNVSETHIVVGDVSNVASRLSSPGKKLLRG